MSLHAVKPLHPRGTYSNSENKSEHKIVEIVVTRSSFATLLMPIIATFSQYDINQYNNRWLTWITDRVPCKEQLLANGVNVKALRLIYVNCNRDNRWLTWEALAQGNSHTVITELDQLTSGEIAAMEKAAIQGGAQGIIVRQNPS